MSNLTGTADTWLQGKLDKDGVWADKVAFKEAILKEYTPHTDSTYAELELPKICQTTMVEDYTEHFQAVVSHIPDMQDGEKCHWFTAGLKESIMQKVVHEQLVTFDDAKLHAKSANLFASKGQGKTSFVVPHSAPTADPNAMDVDALHAPHFPPMSDAEHTYAMANCLCFKHKGTGHISQNCHLSHKGGQKAAQNQRVHNVEVLMPQGQHLASQGQFYLLYYAPYYALPVMKNIVEYIDTLRFMSVKLKSF
ncbi:hypothetical protein FBU31_000518 [Coemansia sp. 'formosensis']|nr:hypothetical protein FBU31_000518 [Coemansia sp. 'formosensis']